MKAIDIDHSTDTLTDLVGTEVTDTMILTRGGQPVGALIPFNEMDLEVVALKDNARLHAILDAARERSRREGTISEADLRRELGLSPHPSTTSATGG